MSPLLEVRMTIGQKKAALLGAFTPLPRSWLCYPNSAIFAPPSYGFVPVQLIPRCIESAEVLQHCEQYGSIVFCLAWNHDIISGDLKQ